MYQKTITPAVNAAVTVEQLAAFGRFDVPQSSPMSADYQLAQLFIAAATEQVEIMAQTAVQPEQVEWTLDFFPNTQDPREFLQYELSYAYAMMPWWWYGFPSKDSIELVRRPVQVPATAGNNSGTITGVSIADNVLTVTVETMATAFTAGQVVLLQGTAEGNLDDPSATPSTTPFLNMAQVTVLTASVTEFTATFNNFYDTSSSGVVTPLSYTNASDTGTATVVTNPLIITYYDQLGVLCTWNTNNYFVQFDKVCLRVGNWWPNTDRRQDCIQITYWAGSATSPANNGLAANSVAPKLQMAILYLANHYWNVRDIVAIEPTGEIYGTLKMLLSSFRTFRIPR